jgi:hypothetical protein
MSVQSHANDELSSSTDPAGRSLVWSFVRENFGLIFCACGFAAGCVFWHYVGFWAVVHAVFYNSNGSGSSAERPAQSQIQVSALATPGATSATGPTAVGLLNVRLAADACTSLTLDRTSGTLTKTPCADEVMPLKSLRAARKEDRRIPVDEVKAAAKPATVSATAPAVASWSTTVVTSPAR